MSRHCTARLALTSLLSLSLFNPALAQDEPVELSGVIYSHWGVDLDHMTNEFDIERVYLTAKRSLSDDFSIRVTTDVGRLKTQILELEGEDVTVDTKTRIFLKYAYLEWKEALPNVRLRLGMSGTAWTGQSDKFWGHHWVQKSFADKHKILASSDLGVQALGTLSGGMVSWQAGIINGTGYDNPESNASKTVQARVSVNALKASDGNLPISAFVSYDPSDFDANGQPEEDAGITYAFGTGYKIDAGNVWAEYVGRSEGATSSSGYTVNAVGHLGNLGHVVLRYDSWDADTSTEEDVENSALAGLAHNYGNKVSMGVFYERTLPQGDAEQSQSVFVRMQAGF